MECMVGWGKIWTVSGLILKWTFLLLGSLLPLGCAILGTGPDAHRTPHSTKESQN